MTYTAEIIKEKIQNSPSWLEHGILAIYARQTSQEQNYQATVDRNNIGFNGPDAHYLSYVATWLQSGKHLSGKHLLKAQQRMIKYSAQLAKIANKEI